MSGLKQLYVHLKLEAGDVVTFEEVDLTTFRVLLAKKASLTGPQAAAAATQTLTRGQQQSVGGKDGGAARGAPDARASDGAGAAGPSTSGRKRAPGSGPASAGGSARRVSGAGAATATCASGEARADTGRRRRGSDAGAAAAGRPSAGIGHGASEGHAVEARIALTSDNISKGDVRIPQKGHAVFARLVEQAAAKQVVTNPEIALTVEEDDTQAPLEPQPVLKVYDTLTWRIRRIRKWLEGQGAKPKDELCMRRGDSDESRHVFRISLVRGTDGDGGRATAAADSNDAAAMAGAGREAVLSSRLPLNAVETAKAAGGGGDPSDGTRVEAGAAGPAGPGPSGHPHAAPRASSDLAVPSTAHLHGCLPPGTDLPALRDGEMRLCGQTFHPELAPLVRKQMAEWRKRLGRPLSEVPFTEQIEVLGGPMGHHGTPDLNHAAISMWVAEILGLEFSDECGFGGELPSELQPPPDVEPRQDPGRGGLGLCATDDIPSGRVIGIFSGYVMPRQHGEAYRDRGLRSQPKEVKDELAKRKGENKIDPIFVWQYLAHSFRVPYPELEAQESAAAAASALGAFRDLELQMLGYGNALALVNDPRGSPPGQANCAVVAVSIRGLVLLALVALSEIAKTQQLLRDYGLGVPLRQQQRRHERRWKQQRWEQQPKQEPQPEQERETQQEQAS
ncbi:hypothetical protein GPECTOR_2g1361 [Gonium pectorale]|uniref:SET domain-containing protein n=1 Tax=Gonium pectorale TaxID=33097 RepID=A0A150H142_GONPE|nr:hypothetical protein GPECTOR_2g1361 [Gonium pectorale]|eukprot:KXZ55811.1 hypothetical protein GPECTOR_2g1361 [Gonium pectorale]